MDAHTDVQLRVEPHADAVEERGDLGRLETQLEGELLALEPLVVGGARPAEVLDAVPLTQQLAACVPRRPLLPAALA
eukprot:5841062-Prymnesium_polylepis.1